MKAASVIITSYNYERYLREAIDSALSQTLRDIEVIVVDDGSTDQSRGIIASYGGRIAAVLKENAGQASAFNAGFAASGGQVVVFLDSDDVLLPTALEEAMDVFHGSDAGKVHWPLAVIDASGVRTGVVLHPDPASGNLRDHVLESGPFSYDWPPTSGNAWARRVLDRILPMPEALYRACPDLYLASLAPLFGPVGRITHPLSLWRDHGANSSFREPFEERLQVCMTREDNCLQALTAHCADAGLVPNLDRWRSHWWWHGIHDAIQDIERLVPDGARFILVDDDAWDVPEVVAGRRKIPFLERDGRYWGPPGSDDEAVAELERLRRAGATCIVFASPSFWWLQQYAGFRRYLDAAFPRALDNDRVVAFDLRNGPSDPAPTVRLPEG